MGPRAPRCSGWLRVALMLALIAVLAARANAQGVNVKLRPSSPTVTPGATFTVYLETTSGGLAFNGFDAVIGYDPAALTLLPTSPISLQEGSYLKSVCGSTFHRFLQGADRDTVTDVLLCNGALLWGPGEIYKLKFRASMTPQVTTVRFLPGSRFYDGGVYVDLAASHDASIGIGVSTGVGDMAIGPTARVVASPNPALSRATLTVESPIAGAQKLLICDLTGRVIRHLQGGNFERGTRSVAWDGRNDSGARMAPGLYLVRLELSGRVASARLTLLN